uniref:Uncharacterized protein LOC111127497 n=1 Tax=Crassostrea virginica TaxID=6565 RepID=A0A8B8DJS5_CRAVI|nr:uncharacterized protein LOC111127497 [Crassostrea virginica]
MKIERSMLFILLLFCNALGTGIAWYFDLPPKYVESVSKRNPLGSTGTNADYESIQKILNQEVLLNKKNHDKEHFLLWLLRNFQQFKDTKQQNEPEYVDLDWS